jgi:hypothetical protein
MGGDMGTGEKKCILFISNSVFILQEKKNL